VAGDSVRGCRFPRPGDWGVLSSGLIDVVTKLLGHFDLCFFLSFRGRDGILGRLFDLLPPWTVVELCFQHD
jgi:hypothetical protein